MVAGNLERTKMCSMRVAGKRGRDKSKHPTLVLLVQHEDCDEGINMERLKCCLLFNSTRLSHPLAAVSNPETER
jgi:hypothetical protein